MVGIETWTGLALGKGKINKMDKKYSGQTTTFFARTASRNLRQTDKVSLGIWTFETGIKTVREDLKTH